MKNMTIEYNAKDWYLYLITDENISRGRSHIDIARAAIDGGADVIQLRDKTSSSRKMYEDAIAIRSLTKAAGVIFIVNDRLDIALASDADGLHVGQNDLPPGVARKLLPADKILGVSAESVTEAQQAEQDGADYLGVGPIFDARSTKPDASEPGGFTLLSGIRNQTSLPIIAIGGINSNNAREVINAGAHGIAVISAIVAADNIQKATQELKELVVYERMTLDSNI